MKTCRSCFFCVPNYTGGMSRFYQGTCYQSNRKVLADMAACNIYKEREETMVVKSKAGKRNTYTDKDGNKIPGVTIPEILDKPITIIAKRKYVWGKYDGMAVKVKGENGNLAIVEITADTPIKAICGHNMPKPPYEAMFVQKTSASKRKYFTIELLGGENEGEVENGHDLPF